MLEHDLTELFEQQAGEHPPPTEASIVGATRSGRARLRRRRRLSFTVPLLAAICVLAVAVSGTLLTPAPAPVPTAPTQGQTHEVPQLDLLPGWLPPGTSAPFGTVYPQHQEHLYVLKGSSSVGSIVSFSGRCTVSRAELSCGKTSKSPLTGRAGTVNGSPAYWSPLGLFFEWGPDQWVTVALPTNADELRAAQHLTAHVPIIRYPFQLAGSWPGVGLLSVGISLTRGRAIAGGMALTQNGNLSAALLALPGNAVQISVAPASSRTGCPSSGTHAVINGYHVIITRTDRHGVDPIDNVCASNADGHIIDVHSEGTHLLAPPSVVFAHIRLLGPDPAKWPTTPFG